MSVFYLSFTYFFFSDVISLSLPLWRNPIGSCSLWSVLGGGGRESPVKHGAAGGASTGDRGQQGEPGPGGGTGGEGPGKNNEDRQNKNRKNKNIEKKKVKSF
jgi:hypothetical protein